MGFILVDRISGAGPGRATGVVKLPAGLGGVPACMAAEAVGQLAAWIAMERSNFTRRPVAGLAARVIAPGTPPSAALLDLEAEIESVDESAVIYSGRALAAGREAVKLEGCVGPMLPLGDFDDPDAMRKLHGELVSSGRSESTSRPEFPRIAPRLLDLGEGVARAELEAPREAGLYADHFPRRAVFPGTLLLDAVLRLVQPLAAASLGLPLGAPPSRVSVTGAKMRSFVEPGTVLELQTRLVGVEGSSVRLRMAARAGRPVATAAVEIAFEEAP